MKRFFIDAVFPRFCVSCGYEGALLCAVCERDWVPRGPFLDLRHRALSSFAYADSTARQLICAWKYAFDQSAWKALQKSLRIHLPGLGSFLGTIHVDAIVPIPLHRRRLCERGFDQAELIARFIGGHFSLPVIETLQRARSTGKQAEKTTRERRRAMRDSPFRAASSTLPCNVLLVDDVWTTGSTARAAARTLRQAGVQNIWTYTLARGT